MQIITAEEYENAMNRVVVPFLEKYKKCGYFAPDGDKGGRLYYESYRRENAKGIVLIAHGFTESAEKYVEMVYYFFREGYQVYILDMRGHGRSVREGEDLSLVHIDHYEHYVSDLEFLAEKIALPENPGQPLYLYGHSMGGGVGAAVLEDQPELFEKAVLSSPMIQPKTGNVPLPAAYGIASVQTRCGHGKNYVIGHHAFQMDETFENSAAVCRERYEFYYRKRLQEKMFQTSGASYGWLKEAIRMSKSVLKEENLRKIRAKILLFQAERDDFVEAEAQNRFAQQAGGVKLVTVPGTKHEIYMSDDKTMEEYVGRILKFWGE